ncbi:hypothetical protein V8C43DRAFT_138072 [Trichoderma afarasin]
MPRYSSAATRPFITLALALVQREHGRKKTLLFPIGWLSPARLQRLIQTTTKYPEGTTALHDRSDTGKVPANRGLTCPALLAKQPLRP